MSDDEKNTYDLKDLCDSWRAARQEEEAEWFRAMVQLLEENNRLRDGLDAVKKERDEARRSVEQWRDVLWGTLPMEVARLELEKTQKERDEARKLAEFWRDEAAAVCDPRDPLGGLHPWEVGE